MTATCLTLLSALMLGQTGGAPAAGDKKEMGKDMAAGKPMVTFVYASSDTFDVSINGTKVAGLSAGKSAEAKDVAAGPAKIEFKSADKVVGSKDATLAADKHYTIVVSGKKDAPKADVIEAKFTAGKAHFIIVHASEAPAVDVNIDGKSVSKGVAMGKNAETDLDAGKHKVELIAGSAEPAASKEIDAKADMCYCVVASGPATKVELTVASHGPMMAKKPMGAAPAPAPEKPAGGEKKP